MTELSLDRGIALLGAVREAGIRIWLEGQYLRASGGDEQGDLMSDVFRHASVVKAALVESPRPHPEWEVGAGDHDTVFRADLRGVDIDRLVLLREQFSFTPLADRPPWRET
jgi:hypothetical protein